ncbi:MAG: 1-aminocyclopropane-1-carboxylate deaminase/D-cysteine desulfhydrase [Bradymonadaceae bacterium]
MSLTRRYPPTSALPKLEFAQLPTPVERCRPLGDAIGVPRLWVKRDDRTGTLYGGNKVRKLEFLLADAVEQGYEDVWTVGAVGSHHVLATCIYARRQGLEPAALHFPQPVTEHVRDNLRALSTTRPDLTLVGNRVQIPVEVLRTKIREWLARGPDVYYIPAGGSSPVGVLGYVNAALELADQVEAGELPEPETVVVAAGTCGTLAGITLGFRLAGLDSRVVGVRVVDRMIANVPTVVRLARKTAGRLDEIGIEDVPTITPDDLELVHDFFGEDYGVPTDEGLRAIELAEEHAGFELEPTYTGKTFAALASGELDVADDRVLYWHTLNGVDLTDRIERADVERDLPDEYGQFFG